MAGRSLLGKQPAKGQQLEDHYFGSVPTRVQAYMAEMEMELYKLGVPVKTRHNEVAPAQFETAPIFEEANIAVDHNQLVMEVLKKVARRHNFDCLLHEKPFAGINGSGKHNNWSLAVTASGEGLDGLNLLDPGKTPHQNLRFLTFLVATLKGVNKHQGLLRAGIASSGNDHRLGANEAPPAIISVFLGDLLSKILDTIEKGEAGSNYEEAVIRMGISKLPEVMKDNTDRNRTSPFAFTGNKFEFRAVGSAATPAFPITMLNAAVADGISEVIEMLKKKGADGKKPADALVFDVIKDVIKETKSIRFEGNNYSEEWVKEAERRGLLNLRKTPESLEQLIKPAAKEMLTRLKVFSEAEVVSRYHVRVEVYVKKMIIEVETLKGMIDTQILPACFAYHGALASAVSSAKAAGVTAPQTEMLNKIGGLISTLSTKRTLLDTLSSKLGQLAHEDEKAKFLCKEIASAMEEVRNASDELEGLVADGYWPLPKYREMLFLS
jgi:glutamine synthetase